jgi:hypothetical protein
MGIYFLKFAHVLVALSLLGLAVYCIVLTGSRKYAIANIHHHNKILRAHRAMLVIVVFALISGSLLVYPKNFTFHTPWIRAAYLFCMVFVAGILGMTLWKKKFVTSKRMTWLTLYILLIIILLGLVHDAVTKTTFLF